MRKNLIFLLLCVFVRLSGQSSLWDDTRVAQMYVSLPADSLAVLYDDVTANHDYLSTFVYVDGAVRDTVTMTGFRLRGNTSRNAAKKSFKISFNAYVPGRRYQGVKQLNLNAQHNDPTCIREKLFYEVWARCGMPLRRTSFVRVYVNGAYYGLYTCLEELDKDWLQQVFQENDGNLYKCTYPADLAYLGASEATYKNIPSGTVTGGRAYDLKTNKAADDYSGFVSLLAALDQASDSVFASRIVQLLNVEGVLRALAIDVATGNWDDYAYNKNNYFLYQGANGQFQFVTYDTDNSFGIDWVNRDWALRDCRDWLRHGEVRPLAEKLLAVPAFWGRYMVLMDSITRYVTAPDSIFARIDAIKALITPDVLDDNYRTLDYGYTMSDFDLGFVGTVDGHTPYGVKPFLAARYTATLMQLGTLSTGDPAPVIADLRVYPNPASQVEWVYLSSSQPVRINYVLQIWDAVGRKCGEGVWTAGMQVVGLRVADLAHGVYVLSVEGGGKRQTVKLVR
jgi:hypothetical protein